MIYLAKTDQEQYDIHTFLGKKENLKSYLIFVIASSEDQMLIGRQITRSKLDRPVNWLLCTADELKDLIRQYKEPFINLLTMEITMTGRKSDVFFAHNWQMLSIGHDPKNDPFDEVFAQTVNYIVDQALYNYNEESKMKQSKLSQLFLDLMATGMLHMQPDPKKAMGN